MCQYVRRMMITYSPLLQQPFSRHYAISRMKGQRWMDSPLVESIPFLSFVYITNPCVYTITDIVWSRRVIREHHLVPRCHLNDGRMGSHWGICFDVEGKHCACVLFVVYLTLYQSLGVM